MIPVVSGISAFSGKSQIVNSFFYTSVKHLFLGFLAFWFFAIFLLVGWFFGGFFVLFFWGGFTVYFNFFATIC